MLPRPMEACPHASQAGICVPGQGGSPPCTHHYLALTWGEESGSVTGHLAWKWLVHTHTHTHTSVSKPLKLSALHHNLSASLLASETCCFCTCR